MAKNKRGSKRKQEVALAEDQTEEVPVANDEQGDAATVANDKDGDFDMDLEDLDSDFKNLSDDEPPTAKKRRHKRRKRDNWAKEIIQNFANGKGAEIKSELQSERPDFTKIEKYF